MASNCTDGYSPYSAPILGIIPDAMYQISDRFGRTMTFEDILIPDDTGAGNPGGGTVGALIVTNNGYKCLAYEPGNHPKFNLHFEDVRLGTGRDFDDPTPTTVIDNGSPGAMTLGAARRRVVCKVFEDLSRLLIARRGSPTVNIRINANSRLSRPVTGVTLAEASPFFYYARQNGLPALPQGLTESSVPRKINADTSTFGCLSTNMTFDGEMAYNFNAFTGQGRYPYWVDFDNQATPPTGNEIDMYSVVLHEAMHLLGIASLMDAGGRGILPANGFCGYYNTYDQHLYTGLTGATELVRRTGNYDWCSTPLNPSNITNLCLNGSALYFGGPAVDPARLNVYTDDGSGFSQGSSLSHFYNGGTCTGSCTYNMCYSYGGGNALNTIKRHPENEEVKVLCDLGYKISGQYGYTDAPVTFIYQGIRNRRYKTYPPCQTCYVGGGMIV